MNDLINIDEFSMDELEVLQQKIVMKQMAKIQKRLEKIESDQAYHNKQNELHISELKEDVNHIQDKLHILAVEPAKLNELRTAIKKRVVSQAGGINSDKYKLFGKLFYEKIGSHLKRSLNVPRYDSIRVEDFNVALTIINRWTPTQKDIKDKLTEYVENEESLDASKKKALNRFLEKNGGKL